MDTFLRKIEMFVQSKIFGTFRPIILTFLNRILRQDHRACFTLNMTRVIKYWDEKRCDMVGSSDTDKPTKDAVCATCGKSVGASVSGSGGEWSFKPVCRCSSGMRVKADQQPASADQPAEKSESETASSDAVFVKSESSSEVDSGGWASVTSAKTASGPGLSKQPKSKTGESGSWKNAAAPKSFRDDKLNSSDSNDSWIEIGSDDFAGPVPDDFNRPVAHEIAKMTSTGATSSGASSSGTSSSGTSLSSSGTNLGVSYSSATNLGGGGASGAYRRGSSKTVEEPVDWVPVKQKPPDKAKSQFANDAELLDLTHKTETAEEKAAKPDTRKAIQDALRRNRIKTIVIAVIAMVLAYGVYSYANTKGLIKKVGILSQGMNSGQQSKKGSGRHSKKNKRTK